MHLPPNKTKIIATIGPASDSPEMLEHLMRAGMNVARLNFSHGDFSAHGERIARIRAAEMATGCRVAIMADLPGPEMRLGNIDPEPIHLAPGDLFTLTSENIVGGASRVAMSFEPLPRVVKPGDRLFLNDGMVQPIVERGAGSEVITATQMLESMTHSRLPTRAEATDVANAILDGTDCLMLSGESAMGSFPEESVAMLAKIAACAEAHREANPQLTEPLPRPAVAATADGVLADVIRYSIAISPVSAVFVPTCSGTTARMIARFKPRVWIVAVSHDMAACQGLAFSCGVRATHAASAPEDWRDFTGSWLREHGLPVRLAILVAGPSTDNPQANHRVEFLRLAPHLPDPD
jgi:pyruvate kinase